MENGLLTDLFNLLEKVAMAVETPERRKQREKAAEASIVVSEDISAEPGCISSQTLGSGDPQTAVTDKVGGTSQGVEGLGKLTPGQELDELAMGCLGAVSAVLRSDAAKETLSHPRNRGLRVLLELATVAESRYSIQ